MGLLDKIRRSRKAAHDPAVVSGDQASAAVVASAAPQTTTEVRSEADEAQERALWAHLREDPNDAEQFHALAERVRRGAGVAHRLGAGEGAPDRVGGDLPVADPQQGEDDAVWSLAEELAHSPKAWYPLIELARLSLASDREAAIRRLGTAADREPTGAALTAALIMLREERLPAEAVNLATSRWRPREHSLDAARAVIESAIEAGRVGDARRSLAALDSHEDAEGVAAIVTDLRPLIDRLEAQLPPRTPAGGLPLVDIQELRNASRRNPFRRD